MFKRKIKSVKEINDKNIKPIKKIELLKNIITEKDKIIEKYKKLNGDIELTEEDELIFTIEKYKKEQEELLNELRTYKKEYADLVHEQKQLNAQIKTQLNV